jgi:hypothetical protein
VTYQSCRFLCFQFVTVSSRHYFNKRYYFNILLCFNILHCFNTFRWSQYVPGFQYISRYHLLKSPYFPLPMLQQPLLGQYLLIIEASRSHSDTPQLVELLWTNDQLDTETSTWKHTTLTKDRHISTTGGDSNPQSQQASSSRTTY